MVMVMAASKRVFGFRYNRPLGEDVEEEVFSVEQVVHAPG
jgi:hypothetical protein